MMSNDFTSAPQEGVGQTPTVQDDTCQTPQRMSNQVPDYSVSNEMAVPRYDDTNIQQPDDDGRGTATGLPRMPLALNYQDHLLELAGLQPSQQYGWGQNYRGPQYSRYGDGPSPMLSQSPALSQVSGHHTAGFYDGRSQTGSHSTRIDMVGTESKRVSSIGNPEWNTANQESQLKMLLSSLQYEPQYALSSRLRQSTYSGAESRPLPFGGSWSLPWTYPRSTSKAGPYSYTPSPQSYMASPHVNQHGYSEFSDQQNVPSSYSSSSSPFCPPGPSPGYYANYEPASGEDRSRIWPASQSEFAHSEMGWLPQDHCPTQRSSEGTYSPLSQSHYSTYQSVGDRQDQGSPPFDPAVRPASEGSFSSFQQESTNNMYNSDYNEKSERALRMTVLSHLKKSMESQSKQSLERTILRDEIPAPDTWQNSIGDSEIQDSSPHASSETPLINTRRRRDSGTSNSSLEAPDNTREVSSADGQPKSADNKQGSRIVVTFKDIHQGLGNRAVSTVSEGPKSPCGHTLLNISQTLINLENATHGEDQQEEKDEGSKNTTDATIVGVAKEESTSKVPQDDKEEHVCGDQNKGTESKGENGSPVVASLSEVIGNAYESLKTSVDELTLQEVNQKSASDSRGEEDVESLHQGQSHVTEDDVMPHGNTELHSEEQTPPPARETLFVVPSVVCPKPSVVTGETWGDSGCQDLFVSWNGANHGSPPEEGSAAMNGEMSVGQQHHQQRVVPAESAELDNNLYTAGHQRVEDDVPPPPMDQSDPDVTDGADGKALVPIRPASPESDIPQTKSCNLSSSSTRTNLSNYCSTNGNSGEENFVVGDLERSAELPEIGSIVSPRSENLPDGYNTYRAGDSESNVNGSLSDVSRCTTPSCPSWRSMHTPTDSWGQSRMAGGTSELAERTVERSGVSESDTFWYPPKNGMEENTGGGQSYWPAWRSGEGNPCEISASNVAFPPGGNNERVIPGMLPAGDAVRQPHLQPSQIWWPQIPPSTHPSNPVAPMPFVFFSNSPNVMGLSEQSTPLPSFSSTYMQPAFSVRANTLVGSQPCSGKNGHPDVWSGVPTGPPVNDYNPYYTGASRQPSNCPVSVLDPSRTKRSSLLLFQQPPETMQLVGEPQVYAVPPVLPRTVPATVAQKQDHRYVGSPCRKASLAAYPDNTATVQSYVASRTPQNSLSACTESPRIGTPSGIGSLSKLQAQMDHLTQSKSSDSLSTYSHGSDRSSTPKSSQEGSVGSGVSTPNPPVISLSARPGNCGFRPRHVPIASIQIGSFQYVVPKGSHKKAATLKVLFGKRKLLYEYGSEGLESPNPKSGTEEHKYMVEVPFRIILGLRAAVNILWLKVQGTAERYHLVKNAKSAASISTRSRPHYQRIDDRLDGQHPLEQYHKIELTQPKAEQLIELMGKFDSHFQAMVDHPFVPAEDWVTNCILERTKSRSIDNQCQRHEGSYWSGRTEFSRNIPHESVHRTPSTSKSSEALQHHIIKRLLVSSQTESERVMKARLQEDRQMGIPWIGCSCGQVCKPPSCGCAQRIKTCAKDQCQCSCLRRTTECRCSPQGDGVREAEDVSDYTTKGCGPKPRLQNLLFKSLTQPCHIKAQGHDVQSHSFTVSDANLEPSQQSQLSHIQNSPAVPCSEGPSLNSRVFKSQNEVSAAYIEGSSQHHVCSPLGSAAIDGPSHKPPEQLLESPTVDSSCKGPSQHSETLRRRISQANIAQLVPPEGASDDAAISCPDSPSSGGVNCSETAEFHPPTTAAIGSGGIHERSDAKNRCSTGDVDGEACCTPVSKASRCSPDWSRSPHTSITTPSPFPGRIRCKCPEGDHQCLKLLLDTSTSPSRAEQGTPSTESCHEPDPPVLTPPYSESDTARGSEPFPQPDSAESKKLCPELDCLGSVQPEPDPNPIDLTKPCSASDPSNASQCCPEADPSNLTKYCLEPDATSSAQSCPEPDPTRQTESCAEPDATSSAQSCPEPDSTRQTQSCPEPDPTGQAQSCPEPDSTRQAQSCPEPDSTRQTQSYPEPDPTRQTQSCPEPDSTRQAQSCPEPDSTRQTQSCPEPDATSLAHSESHPTDLTLPCAESDPTSSTGQHLESDPKGTEESCPGDSCSASESTNPMRDDTVMKQSLPEPEPTRSIDSLNVSDKVQHCPVSACRVSEELSPVSDSTASVKLFSRSGCAVSEDLYPSSTCKSSGELCPNPGYTDEPYSRPGCTISKEPCPKLELTVSKEPCPKPECRVSEELCTKPRCTVSEDPCRIPGWTLTKEPFPVQGIQASDEWCAVPGCTGPQELCRVQCSGALPNPCSMPGCRVSDKSCPGLGCLVSPGPCPTSVGGPCPAPESGGPAGRKRSPLNRSEPKNPAKTQPTPKRSRKGAGPNCGCVKGCKSQRCRCMHAKRMCTLKCSCQISGTCSQIVELFHTSGVTTEDILANPCLSDNVTKERHMKALIESLVSLPCCDFKVSPTDLTSPFPCPGCLQTCVFSWCTGVFQKGEIKHCSLCHACKDTRHIHDGTGVDIEGEVHQESPQIVPQSVPDVKKRKTSQRVKKRSVRLPKESDLYYPEMFGAHFTESRAKVTKVVGKDVSDAVKTMVEQSKNDPPVGQQVVVPQRSRKRAPRVLQRKQSNRRAVEELINDLEDKGCTRTRSSQHCVVGQRVIEGDESGTIEESVQRPTAGQTPECVKENLQQGAGILSRLRSCTRSGVRCQPDEESTGINTSPPEEGGARLTQISRSDRSNRKRKRGSTETCDNPAEVVDSALKHRSPSGGRKCAPTRRLGMCTRSRSRTQSEGSAFVFDGPHLSSSGSTNNLLTLPSTPEKLSDRLDTFLPVNNYISPFESLSAHLDFPDDYDSLHVFGNDYHMSPSAGEQSLDCPTETSSIELARVFGHPLAVSSPKQGHV